MRLTKAKKKDSNKKIELATESRTKHSPYLKHKKNQPG